MKKTLLFLFVFCIPWLLQAQEIIEGRVIDEGGHPLPFVNIRVDGAGRGGTTDLDGKFRLELPSKPQQLQFSYMGFESKSIAGDELKAKELEVVLVEKNTFLEEVTVLPGENPAHRLIQNAVKFRDRNDPMNRESFQYKSYSKFWVTFNPDSIDPKIDSVMLSDRKDSLASNEADSLVRIDSSNFKMHQFFSARHLFFMETLTERRYKDPRDNETVLAQRTSGFKNPLFSLLITQLQDFSFYGDYFGISDKQYLNPISKGSTSRYYFLIEDSVFTASGDTLFSVSFRPRPNKGFSALKGVITLHSGDWAIVNVRAQPADEMESLPIRIRQEYQKFGADTWFPVAFEADIFLRNLVVNGMAPEIIMRGKLLDIDIDPQLEKRDINRSDLTIDNKASKLADTLLNQYRPDTLSSREREAYAFLDSVGEEENFDRNLKVLLAITRGYIPYGPINFDLQSLMNFNVREGFRLGLGVETNDKLLSWARVGAYGAYGFKDQLWKYGGHLEVDLSTRIRAQVKGGFQRDIFELGSTDLGFAKRKGITDDFYRRLNIENWDLSEVSYLQFKFDPLPRWTYTAQWRQKWRQSLSDYRFLDRNRFRFTELRQGLRFSPNEKIVDAPMGRLSLSGENPLFQLEYHAGLPLAGNTFDYHKIMFQADWKRVSRRFGVSSFRLKAGRVFGDIPAQLLFGGSANQPNAQNFTDRITISDRYSFETMRFNEFLSNELVELQWRQDFKSLLFKRDNFAPHIELVQRFAWGRMNDLSPHQGIGAKSLEAGFWESGLELNRLIQFNFSGLGIGVYYRYGAQQLPNFEDNIALKLSSKFVLD